MLHPMGPHPQSMGFQPKTETNAADYQVSELKLFFVRVSFIKSFRNFAALKAFLGKQSEVYLPSLNLNSNYFNKNWPKLVTFKN